MKSLIISIFLLSLAGNLFSQQVPDTQPDYLMKRKKAKNNCEDIVNQWNRPYVYGSCISTRRADL